MKGSIKYANVSIKYKSKRTVVRGKQLYTDFQATRAVPVVITIDEENRILKFKKRTINRVCRDLGLNQDLMFETTINSIEILKDLGKTVYDI